MRQNNWPNADSINSMANFSPMNNKCCPIVKKNTPSMEIHSRGTFLGGQNVFCEALIIIYQFEFYIHILLLYFTICLTLLILQWTMHSDFQKKTGCISLNNRIYSLLHGNDTIQPALAPGTIRVQPSLRFTMRLYLTS